MPKFTVGIVGAGLGGLVLALALEKYAPDVEVQIYEGAAKLTEVGAGIGMHKRIWDLLTALGLDETLNAIRGNEDDDVRKTTFKYRKADQAEGFIFLELTQSAIKTFHRGEVQAALVKHIKSTKINVSKRVASYVDPADPTQPLELRFTDGTSATADVVIGSDGIRSTTRRVMYTALADAAGDEQRAAALRTHIDPIWPGSLAYRTLVPREVVIEKNGGVVHPALLDPIMYSGVNRTSMTYAVSNGRAMFIGFNTLEPPKNPDSMYSGAWVTDVPTDEVRPAFEGWEPEFQVLLNSTTTLQKWAAHRVKPLPTYVHGRVALLGDAAHAMMQFQGAGAGQAFEDGFVLAHLLASPKVTRENLTAALRIYDDVRRPFSQRVAELSHLTARLTNLQEGPCKNLTAEASKSGKGVSAEDLAEVAVQLQKSISWMEETRITEEAAEAVKRLEQVLAA